MLSFSLDYVLKLIVLIYKELAFYATNLSTTKHFFLLKEKLLENPIKALIVFAEDFIIRQKYPSCNKYHKTTR